MNDVARHTAPENDLRLATTDARAEMQQRIDALIAMGFTRTLIDRLLISRPTLFSADRIKGTIQGLRDRGFVDPVKLITTFPAVFSYSFENIDAKMVGLRDRGFTNPVQLITKFPTALAYSLETIDVKIAGLCDRGFDPVKIIEALPQAISYSFENIDAKVAGLRDRGFADPVKLIIKSPAALIYSFEAIDAKMAGLRDRGFVEPVKLITTAPSMFGYSLGTIDAKMTGLSERGFVDPVKLITTLPMALHHSLDDIDAKIVGLRDRGFADPVKLITASPAVVGYSLDAIDAKMEVLQRAFQRYEISLDAADVITKLPTILGTKNDKLWTIARILRWHAKHPTEITTTSLNTCLFARLPLLLVAHLRHPDADITTLLRETRKLKNEKLSSDEIEAAIRAGEGDKAVARYRRGYPAATPKKAAHSRATEDAEDVID